MAPRKTPPAPLPAAIKADVELQDVELVAGELKTFTPKPGYTTSEFALAVVVVLCASVLCGLGKIDADAWSLVAGGSSAGYAISRGLAKR